MEAVVREARSSRLRALAAELRADRLIAFLQAEALQVLAAAGSDRLATLSGGRYRLTWGIGPFYFSTQTTRRISWKASAYFCQTSSPRLCARLRIIPSLA